MDRGTQSAGQRPHRATVRHAAGPPGKRNAPGRDRQPRGRQSFLEMRFLPAWEERFTVAPRSSRKAHRRLDAQQRLEEILSVRVGRQVADDHTVSWDGHRWGVPREEVCAGLRGAQVEVERRLDGSHWLRFRGRYLRLHCPAAAPRAVSPSGLRPAGLTANALSKVYKSAPPNHPWRTFLYGRKPDISTLR